MTPKRLLWGIGLSILFAGCLYGSYELGRRSVEHEEDQIYISDLSAGLVKSIQLAAAVRAGDSAAALKQSENYIDSDLITFDQFIQNKPTVLSPFSLSALRLASIYRSKYNSEYLSAISEPLHLPGIARALEYGRLNGVLAHGSFADKYLSQP